MFIIFGWGRTTMHVLGWAPVRRCANCHNEGPWVVARVRRWFTVFFIPILPYESRYVAMCPVCSRGFDIDRDRASDLIQGQRGIPQGEGSAGISGPKQELVAGGVRSPRRRGYRALVVVGVAVAIIVVLALIGAGQKGGGTAPGVSVDNGSSSGVSVDSGSSSTPPVADAFTPASRDLDRLRSLVQDVVRLNNGMSNPDRKTATLLATRFSSLATKIDKWRGTFPEASPSTRRLSRCAVVNARAIAAMLRNPTKHIIRNYDRSRLAFNKAWDNWTPSAALMGL